jgi:hypothetical protein
MTPAAWYGFAAALFGLAVFLFKYRQHRRRMRRFAPPLEWPRPFEYCTLEPPRRIKPAPRYVWTRGQK